MRLLAIGDIHGCYQALKTLAVEIPIEPDDMVVVLGDYVDRGSGSARVLDWVIERHRARRLIPLMGNHELMMLAARDDQKRLANWMSNGGDATLRSNVPPTGLATIDDVPAAHWQFLEDDCLPNYQMERHFFVHANVYPHYPLEDQPDSMLYWEHLDEWSAPHESGKVMICGHTPQRSGIPLNLGHAVCIDTEAHAGGWLTCLDVLTSGYWQANEQGQFRKRQLSAPPCDPI